MEILARAVGRRKEAVAQVQIVKGSGQFIINNIPASNYLHNNNSSLISIQSPYTTLNIVSEADSSEAKNTNSSANSAPIVGQLNEIQLNSIDTIVKVKGGGLVGQAEAIKLGVARALCAIVNSNNLDKETVRKELKGKGLLTQDSRVKERRKYGLRKARKASQYHKR